MSTEQNHAYDNAKGWAGTIAEMVAALECDYARLADLREDRADHADDTAADGLLAEWNEEYGEELADLITAATYEGELQTDSEGMRERIQESPLSIEVRSGWYSPTGETQPSEDFMILLSTGGPALRIRGELSEYCEPTRAWLEYQDWGTPWTEYHGEGCEHKTLLTFCKQFYFGE